MKKFFYRLFSKIAKPLCLIGYVLAFLVCIVTIVLLVFNVLSIVFYAIAFIMLLLIFAVPDDYYEEFPILGIIVAIVVAIGSIVIRGITLEMMKVELFEFVVSGIISSVTIVISYCIGVFLLRCWKR